MKECIICGQEYEKEYSVNVAVFGEPIHIEGHPFCLERVNQFVMLPNRHRFDVLMDIAEKVDKEMKAEETG